MDMSCTALQGCEENHECRDPFDECLLAAMRRGNTRDDLSSRGTGAPARMPLPGGRIHDMAITGDKSPVSQCVAH